MMTPKTIALTILTAAALTGCATTADFQYDAAGRLVHARTNDEIAVTLKDGQAFSNQRRAGILESAANILALKTVESDIEVTQ